MGKNEECVVKESENRNSEVDFWRLIFAIVVVMCHGYGLRPPDPQKYPFAGGYLAVEFFLILTGYFSVQKAMKSKMKNETGQNVLQWTMQKFYKIYPYAVPAIILHYSAYAWVNKLSFRDALKNFSYGLFETALLPASGIYESFLDLPVWYLSAMLFVLPLFFLMLIKLQENTVAVICFLSSSLIYGYFSRTIGHIDQWSTWTGLFHISLIRVWAGFCVGWIVFQISSRLGAIHFTSLGEKFLALIEVISGGTVFFYMFTRTHRRLDFLCIGLLAIFVGIILSGKASLHRSFSSSWNKFAKYSLVIYVSHWTVRMLLPVMMPIATYGQMWFPYVILSCLYAELLMILVDVIRKCIPWDRLKGKICFPFVENGGK